MIWWRQPSFLLCTPNIVPLHYRSSVKTSTRQHLKYHGRTVSIQSFMMVTFVSGIFPGTSTVIDSVRLRMPITLWAAETIRKRFSYILPLHLMGSFRYDILSNTDWFSSMTVATSAEVLEMKVAIIFGRNVYEYFWTFALVHEPIPNNPCLCNLLFPQRN